LNVWKLQSVTCSTRRSPTGSFETKRGRTSLAGSPHAQAELIHARTEALVDTATANPEPWSAKLRPSSDDASLQRALRRDLGNVVAFRDLNQVTDTESPLGAVRTDDDAYTAAAASLERLRVVEGTTAAEARRRVAGLRQRLSGNSDVGGAVDVAERVRRLRERHVEHDKPASDDEPSRRGPGHRPTV
jgi:hypothetical protein